MSKRKLSASQPANPTAPNSTPAPTSSSSSVPSHPPLKKRTLQSSNGNAPPPPPPTVGYGVTFGVSSEKSELELLQYQNQSLARALKDRKEEVADLKSQLARYQAMEKTHNNTLSFVNHYWNALDENLQVLLARIDVRQVPEIISQERNNEVDVSEQNKKTFLQMLLREEGDADGDDEGKGKERDKGKGRGDDEDDEEEQIQAMKLRQRVDQALEGRMALSQQILIRVCDAVQREQERNAELSQLLLQVAEKSQIEKTVLAENSALKAKEESLRGLLDKLQFDNKKMAKEINQCKTGWLQAERRVKEMTYNVEDLRSDLSTAHNRLERLNKALQDAQKETKQVGASASSSSSSSTSGTSGSSSAGKGEVVEGEEFQKLREELRETKDRENLRLSELKRLRQEKNEAAREAASLTEKLANLPETAVRASPFYVAVQQQLHLAILDLDQQRGQCSQLQRTLATLEQERREEREKFQKGELARRQDLEKELKEKDSTLVRIRGERDSLMYRLDQKKASLPSSKVIGEFKIMIASLKDSSTKLKEENERLKAKLESQKPSDSKSGDTSGLQEKYQSAKRMIEDLQRREKQWDDSRRDLKIALDAYQGLSKERRELAEIRRSEKRLLEDNTRLASRLAKYEKDARSGHPPSTSSSSSSSSPSSSSSSSSPSSSSSSSSSSPSSGQDLNRALAKAEKSVRELTKSLDAARKENAGYMSEIEVIAKEFESMQEQNARLVLQLSEKDDANTKLMSERIKSEQQQHLLREEAKTLGQQIKLANEMYQTQREVLQKEEAKVKSLEEQLAKATEQVNLLNQAIELHKRSSRDTAQQLIDLRAKLEHMTKTAEEMRRKLEEQAGALDREEEHSSRILEERNVIKKKLERLSTRTADSLLEDELASVKKMLRCPVCEDRLKDTVITRCFHVFCNDCVRSRLALRNRKCPACAHAFGERDVHSIYLDVRPDEIS